MKKAFPLDPPRRTTPPHQPQALKDLLNSNADVFCEAKRQTTTKTVTHQIILTQNEPFRLRPHRYSSSKLKVIRSAVEEMLASGVIRQSNSPYSWTIVIVSKKNGELSFCLDYRRLNGVTATESACLPPIKYVIRNMGDGRVFSTIDLKSCDWQIPVDKHCKQNTAFSTPDGRQFEF